MRCDDCRQAAEGGDAEAHAHLGHMYANGVGVDQSNDTARQYFQGAADAGNPSGQFGLGYMHLTGQAVQQDYSTAFKLFQHASEAVSLCLWFAALLLLSALPVTVTQELCHVHQALHLLLAHRCNRCSQYSSTSLFLAQKLPYRGENTLCTHGILHLATVYMLYATCDFTTLRMVYK